MNKKTIRGISAKRSINLIDIENLCATSEFTEEQAALVRKQYLQLVQPKDLDQFLVTSSHHNMQATCFGWPGAEKGFKSGKDGAETLLAKRIVEGHLQDNFNHVYVGSGDGGLVEFVEHLLSKGVPVTIVSRMDTISGRMRNSGAEILWLDSEYQLAA